MYGVPILYTVKKGGDGGGGGEVRGAFEQVLRGHIFHVTLFSIALQSGLFKPSSFFRHFFNLSLFFYGLFITHLIFLVVFKTQLLRPLGDNHNL